MAVLAGDIGGTKTVLEISQRQEDQLTILARQQFSSQAYDSFADLLGEFLARFHKKTSLQSACFGVAGPVEEDENGVTSSNITNLAWQIDSNLIARQFKIGHVQLINDFVAVGHGIEVLDRNDLLQLQAGDPGINGNRLVIGAGTGLGVAQIVRCKEGYRVFGTEGGHTDFAPVDERQIQLLRYLISNHGRASCEEVLSGPGLVNIYHYLHQARSGDKTQLDHILNQEDQAAAISAAAEKGTDPVAQEALELFVEIYGSVSGNFALSSMATAGVFIAGGIAPKISSQLAAGSFIRAFNAKGKMAHLNRQMPVAVVMNPDVGLMGARYIAENNL